MNEFNLTPKQINELRMAHRATKDKRYACRINAVLLLGSGWTQEEVSEALMFDEGTLRN